MFIITKRHGIFNANNVVITCDGETIYALVGDTWRPISCDHNDMKVIVEGIKAGKPYVELGGEDGQE